MNRIVTFARSLLGLDDSIPEEKADSRRQLRWRVGVGAAIVTGLVALSLAVLMSIITSVGSTTEVPLELRSTPSPGTSSRASAAHSQAGEALVHIVGAVREPGIYHVSAGARVVDVVMAAGGFTDAAQLCAVNMARTITDGEQVTIPQGDPNDCSAGGAASSTAAKKVSLNRGSVADFDALPGIGPTLAQRIIDWRLAHGSFTALTQLIQVSGISEKLYASIKDLLVL
jgi:competence protein ComEA